MKIALTEAQTNLERAQCRMAKAVNRSRRSEQYNIGDEVVLSTTNLRNYCPHLLAKLRARWVGPFTISRVVSPVAYKVDLPPGSQIHLVFHIDRYSGNPLYHHYVGFQCGTHYLFTWDDLWITRFCALIPFAAFLTCHSKNADLGNFGAFFLVRSVGHASARAMFRCFSQGYKALQAYSWSD